MSTVLRILLAVQGTGNGHLSRARELLPYLQKHGEVDLLLSGSQVEVGNDLEVKYRVRGLGFVFGKKGGVDIATSVARARPIRMLYDALTLPLHRYQVIINDFEPVVALAARWKGRTLYGISHQSALLSPHSPRPKGVRAPFAEKVLRQYAPCTAYTGLHFEAYDHYITTPVIRKAVRALTTTLQGHVTVYLPAIADDRLIWHLSKIRQVQWHVFSKHSALPYHMHNVWVRPINETEYTESLSGSIGLLTGGGFESPAEALFLGKRLMVIPMHNQYEQLCNAAALERLGVRVVQKVEENFSHQLRIWLREQPLKPMAYPDQTAQIVDKAVGWSLTGA